MAVETVGQIIQSIGKQFDGNRDGALKRTEKYAFLNELSQRLAPYESAGSLSSDASAASTTPLTSPPSGAAAAERSDLNHLTDFLTLRAADGRTLYTHLYAGYSDTDRAAVRQALQERGYSHIYLYAMNEGDYRGQAVFDGYDDPVEFRQILQELVDDGLAPVVWLSPDDAPRFHQTSAQTLPARWDRFIPVVDDLVSSYVVGLEMDEYWTHDEQEQLGGYLNGLTNRPLFVHYTPGEWEGAKSSWVDGLIYQYGFGLSEEAVSDRTQQLVSRLHPLGKTFIAGEYAHRIPEAEARRLGVAALRAGADGVGNGAYV